MTKKKKFEDICFPVPKDISVNLPQKVDDNLILKKHLFQQTIQTAYQISIPYGFTSSYELEKPHQLVTEEQIETVVSLFQAIQPQDSIEAALAQQFIIVHLQAIESAKSGLMERDLKKFELTHQILKTLREHRNKGTQQISVQYVHHGQIVNDSLVNIKTRKKEPEPIIIEGESL